ncbi:tRNA (adenosine(37)-N6)-threonylcarbamoyltransferase complex dimerization subunit type 1 TsaB [Boudabousia liubingyangii]|uniref:tRNA (adenosine(37)-N6)-threonylcarbamoyltransferase complex dimerization subunit type 1 TsaB n=1 Tax=Boudabousia liubingyangii TaxID=1921764 RepID=UPI00093993C9|nr:tRNA (adenosine(37)-N6)-threonylcarbamoyltransferase complex dimerization subunit type 1 TsaB [Boudabousia liubingyangii]OKL48216.1 tRNA (adenosine(37)-N6)-threonylcarbamoyltransferase complex dimerization subunit type 1 TsaB [Boudabousia liubingyangii]
MSTRFLCIDTAMGSRVALVDGDEVKAAAQALSARAHAEALMGLIHEVCGRPEGESLKGCFDAIVVGRGPAPFTGLRAGLVTAQALGFSCSVPVYGVSALDLAARCALDQLDPAGQQGSEVLALLDARRKELYAARFRAQGTDDVQLLDEYQVVAPADLAAQVPPTEELPRVGPAASLYSEVVGAGQVEAYEVAGLARIAQARLGGATGMEPEGSQLAAVEAAKLAEFNLELTPLYLRRPDVQVSKSTKSALG